MSGDVVNLRLARKAKRRGAATETGAANRAKFGRTRAERDIAEIERYRIARHLDGHLLPTDTEPPAGDAGVDKA